MGGGSSFSDFFESLFGGEMSAEDFTEASRQPRARHGVTHEAEITISLADAFRGATRQISLESEGGDGDSASRTYDVKIPPGTTDGSTIRLPGQGGAGAAGGQSGDLLLHIRIASDPRFRIDPHDKHNLIATLPISPAEAALGAKIDVPTLAGSVRMTVPAGSQSGQRLRIRAQGLPRRNGEHGDLFVDLKIVVPKELSDEERAAYEQLARVSRTDPRTT